MTSQEIQQTEENKRTVAGWLKEIAYQLAVANERGEPDKPFLYPIELNSPGVDPERGRRGPGKPPKVKQ